MKAVQMEPDVITYNVTFFLKLLSWERIHIPPQEKEHHLQTCLGVGHVSSRQITLPETNSEFTPKNGWLKDAFPIGEAYFPRNMLVSWRVITQRFIGEKMVFFCGSISTTEIAAFGG